MTPQFWRNLSKMSKSTFSKRLTPYLFIAPFWIVYLLFGAYPALYGFVLGFFSTQGLIPERFIGLKNFTDLFADQRFYKALFNTTYYAAGSLFVILPIALIIALGIHAKIVRRIKGFLTTAYFLPFVTPAIVAAIMFTLIFGERYGLLNYYLGFFNIEPIPWIRLPAFAMPALIILGIWRYAGINALYFLAGLQSIPDELYEAALIDGASRAQTFYYITLPLLRPIMLFVTITAIIGSYQLFDEAYILGGQGSGGAGPGDSMLMMTAYLYINGFQFLRLGYAAAIGVVMMAIMMTLALIQIKILGRGEMQ